jgi:hypothetical protein
MMDTSTTPNTELPAVGYDWIAVLGYAECPLWDTMESHANVIIRDLKERWIGTHEGEIQRDEARACVIVPFSIPPEHHVPAEEILQFLASEWSAIAGDGGSVTLERAGARGSDGASGLE